MKRLLSLLAICIIFFSCSEEDTIKPNKGYLNGDGTILATIYIDGKAVGEGVTVVTYPSTYLRKTDASGQVEFKNIVSGSFDVYANTDYGSGKTFVKLNHDVQHIDINLIRGVSIIPDIWITSPDQNQGFAEGEEIEFAAIISDHINSIEELRVVWKSDLDGIIEGEADLRKGRYYFKTSNLSAGVHHIKATVINLPGFTHSDDIVINTLTPGPFSIELEKKPNLDIAVSWSTPSGKISKYEIYRVTDLSNTPELITILDSQTKEFIDTNVPSADRILYYIKAYNSLGYFRISISEIAELTN